MNKIHLIKDLGAPRYRNLVFTSAGKNSQVSRWHGRKREFDIFVVSYAGEINHALQNSSDYYLLRKGNKFGNLFYIYQNFRSILDNYEAFFILDDDLTLGAEDINKMFKISRLYDLAISQPAFNLDGKISWPHTKMNPKYILRYSSFVEMGAPLFEKFFLYKFLENFQADACAWGIDFWYSQLAQEMNLLNKVAIVHDVTCTNPHDLFKGNRREIDAIEGYSHWKNEWEKTKTLYGIAFDESSVTEFGGVLQPKYKVPSRYLKLYWLKYWGKVWRFLTRLKNDRRLSAIDY